VEKRGKGFYTVKVHHGLFEPPDVPQTLDDARRLALDAAATLFFVGRKTLVPADHSELSRWRNWSHRSIAANAPSPARFCRLLPNRVVELGIQAAI
jgi:KUP system potassium uptake protein